MADELDESMVEDGSVEDSLLLRVLVLELALVCDREEKELVLVSTSELILGSCASTAASSAVALRVPQSALSLQVAWAVLSNWLSKRH